MRASTLLLAAALGAVLLPPPDAPPAARQKRMSFSNRLLLNRAVVSGLRTVEVLLLTEKDGDAPAVAALGGRIVRDEPAIGYLRVDVPIDRLLDLVHSPTVAAYQISSLSRGSWYRDGPPLRNATAARSAEVTPVNVAEPKVVRPDLPLLTVAESRQSGYTADDIGVAQWLKTHPTFDGRGVTIALLENALPSFLDPTVGTAKTLDGRDVPKIAGILNAPADRAADDTRVALDTIIDAATTWTRVGSRTYILPRTGRYRFGTYEVSGGANVVQRFAVLEDEQSRQVWIDANGDASFQDERPLVDVNERFEPRYLSLRHPAEGRASFVMARGQRPHTVHIYLGRGSHQTMTLSVAAGSSTDKSLAVGVAPNARVLLVNIASADPALARLFEGFFEAARRPDVDVISTSWGMMLIPDSDADFSGAFFTRLADTYGKPIFNSAGNRGPLLASADGSMLSVGGHLSPETWAALYGGRALDATIVHPMSAAGPSLDGAIKPDFLAPMERIAADLLWNADLNVAPIHTPSWRLPAGYQIACCTSATSPYAAGVAALLISAAKQSGVPYAGERIGAAMRLSARILPGFPAHRQGNGMLDLPGAWRALAQYVERPRITAAAAIVHSLAQYAARGNEGQGILEFEGWRPGMTGTRDITFTRESGPADPQTYRLAWIASDSTFATPASVALPLRTPVTVPVRVGVRTPGVHSGLLELRDMRTDAPVFRTQATVVGVERVDPVTRTLRSTATLTNLSHRSHYVEVPAGTTAITFELEVIRGVVHPTIVPSHGLFPSYYMHAYPLNVFHSGKGKYVVRLPNPQPGTWTLQIETNSRALIIPWNQVASDDSDAEYALTVRLQDGRREPAGSVVEASPGYLRSHRGRFLDSGLPNMFDIDVAPDTATLALDLRTPGGPKTELYLYDCTTGECFSYNFGFPAANAHTLTVRKPNAGRWVAAVNAAPFPAASGTFVLDEVQTFTTPSRSIPGATPVMVTELIDAAAERAEREHPWSTASNYVTLRDRPIAIRRAIQPR